MTDIEQGDVDIICDVSNTDRISVGKTWSRYNSYDMESAASSLLLTNLNFHLEQAEAS